MGVFFAITGFLRGWNKELVSLVGIVLAMFALFQFDGLLRGTIFLALPPTQVFLLQAAVFIAMVVFLYQGGAIGSGTDRRDEDDWQAGFLGAGVGFFNGYLVAGTLWYFLDINEYPFEELIVAPAANSLSAQAVNLMPLVIVGGGASGTGDILAVVVLVLLFMVLMVV
jgi:hypothetical protein